MLLYLLYNLTIPRPVHQQKNNVSNLPINTIQSTEIARESNLDTWFGNLIDTIKVDHLMMVTDTAPKEKKDFYDAMMSGQEKDVFCKMREGSSMFFIKSILSEYLSELYTDNHLPLKLAMGLSDSKLLVWSEIEDDDEETEKKLLIVEAKVNGKYSNNGFFINSTIIERSDNMPIPPHYQTLIS